MEPQDYPHKFFGSSFNAFFIILISFGFVVAVIYGLTNGHADVAATVFLLSIAVVFFAMGWRQLTSKTPRLQFGPTGIWTPKLGHLSWRQITLKLGSVYAGKAGSMYTVHILELQTQRHLEGVVISGLDYSFSHTESALRSYSCGTPCPSA